MSNTQLTQNQHQSHLRGGRMTKLNGEAASCADEAGHSNSFASMTGALAARGLLPGLLLGAAYVVTPSTALATCIEGSVNQFSCGSGTNIPVLDLDAAGESVTIDVGPNSTLTNDAGAFEYALQVQGEVENLIYRDNGDNQLEGEYGALYLRLLDLQGSVDVDIDEGSVYQATFPDLTPDFFGPAINMRVGADATDVTFRLGGTVIQDNERPTSFGFVVANGISLQDYGGGDVFVELESTSLVRATGGVRINSRSGSFGDVTVISRGEITGNDTALNITNSGDGNLFSDVYGSITSNRGFGVSSRVDQGYSDITVHAGAEINSYTAGIFSNGATGSEGISITHNGMINSERLGIWALSQSSRGGISITGSGEIIAKTTGIVAQNFADGEGFVSIYRPTDSNTAGGDDGIFVDSEGGHVMITALGAVSGDTDDYAGGDGIVAITEQDTTYISITTGDGEITGVNGIVAEHSGAEGVSITTGEGSVSGRSGDGIQVTNSGTSSQISTQGAVIGSQHGVNIFHTGSGPLEVTLSGVTTGQNGYGVYNRAFSQSGEFTISSTGSVSGGNGIAFLDASSGNGSTLDVTGTILGDVQMRNGDDAVTILSGAILGGDGAVLGPGNGIHIDADTPSTFDTDDVLVFDGWRGNRASANETDPTLVDIDGAQINNFETVVLTNGADVTWADTVNPGTGLGSGITSLLGLFTFQVDSGSTARFVDDFRVNGDVIASGALDLSTPNETADTTLTVTGNFQSNGGALVLDTRLDDGNSAPDQSDVLVVDSSETLSGPTLITVVPTADSTGMRTDINGNGEIDDGEGILVVDVLGGETSSAVDAFALSGVAAADGIAYFLNRGENSGDWFLANTLAEDVVGFCNADITVNGTTTAPSALGCVTDDTLTVAEDASVDTIEGAGGSDTITIEGNANAGKIFGGNPGQDDSADLDTGDTITINTTGTVANIDGQLGDDVIDLLAGTVTGNVAGSEGNDTLTLNGATIAGAITGDAGDDAFTWSSGTMTSFDGGDGSDTAVVTASEYDGSQILDGGDDYAVADTFIDTLTLQGISLAATGANIVRWENVIIDGGTVSFADNMLEVGADDGTGLTITNGGVVDGGTMINLTGNMTVDADGTFQGFGGGAGEFNISNNVTNLGVITIQDDAAGDVITVGGNYTGGGQLLIDTTLDDDNSPTDMLVVGGDTSGSTDIDFNVVGGSGDATMTGILVVEVGGDTAGTFAIAPGTEDATLGGESVLVAGAYSYALRQGPDGNWYLQSDLTPVTPDPDPDPDPDPEPEPTPANPAGPIYEAMPASMMALNGLPTMQQRVGNRYWQERTPAAPVETVFCKDASQNFQCPVGAEEGAVFASATEELDTVIEGSAVWARIDGAHNHVEPDFSTTYTDYDVTAWTLQAGVDGVFVDNEDGKLFAGLNFSYGQASADVSSTLGTGTDGLASGEIDTTGYSIGATLTWLGESGFYADAQAQYSWYDNELDSDNTTTALDDVDGEGYALSLELGQRIEATETLTLIPQAQLVYSAVDFDTFTDNLGGGTVSLEDGDSLKGRLGLAVEHANSWQADDGTTSRSAVYGIANLHYEFLDGTNVAYRFNGETTAYRSDADALSGELGIGGTYNWNDDKYSIYGEARASTSLENFGDSYGIGGNLGFRVAWQKPPQGITHPIKGGQ